jgi:hypothetical protein
MSLSECDQEQRSVKALTAKERKKLSMQLLQDSLLLQQHDASV